MRSRVLLKPSGTSRCLRPLKTRAHGLLVKPAVEAGVERGMWKLISYF